MTARFLAQKRSRHELKPLRIPLRRIVETPFILNFSTRWRWVVNLTLQLPYPRQRTRQSLTRRLSVPHSRSGCFGEEKNLLLLPGFEPRTVQLIAQWLFRTSIWTRYLQNKIRSTALWAILFGITRSVFGTETISCFHRTLRGSRPTLSLSVFRVIKFYLYWVSRYLIIYCELSYCRDHG